MRWQLVNSQCFAIKIIIKKERIIIASRMQQQINKFKYTHSLFIYIFVKIS